MNKTIFACLTVLMLAIPMLAHAQGAQEPIEITADNELVWNRQDQYFTAEGNAKAAQGGVSIAAQILKALYSQEEGKSADIYQFEAEDSVVLKSNGNTAYGDRAQYHVKKEYAVLTGKKLRLVTPEQTLYARDKFEYFIKEGRLLALGRVILKRPTDTLKADRVTAYLKEGYNGKRRVTKVIAQGNVSIETKEERVTGRKGIYNAVDNIVTLEGDVVITRGKNILKGEKATVDLTTQVSKLFGGSEAGQGRVRGVFYPDKTLR